jgi:hypothetical protein
MEQQNAEGPSLHRKENEHATDDERDNAGVIAPPPLIYLVPLILGLLLKRKFPIPFLPRRATRLRAC